MVRVYAVGPAIFQQSPSFRVAVLLANGWRIVAESYHNHLIFRALNVHPFDFNTRTLNLTFKVIPGRLISDRPQTQRRGNPHFTDFATWTGPA